MLQLRVGRFISGDRAGGGAAAWWHRGDAPAERHSRTTAGAGTAQSVKRIARCSQLRDCPPPASKRNRHAPSILIAMRSSATGSEPSGKPAAKQRKPLTARWLADRYVVDKLTAEEISELSGWSSQYVRDRLRDFGIPLRRPGTHARLRTKLDRETLTAWLQDGLSGREISDRSGYTTSGVYKLLRQFNLTVPGAALGDGGERAERLAGR